MDGMMDRHVYVTPYQLNTHAFSCTITKVGSSSPFTEEYVVEVRHHL